LLPAASVATIVNVYVPGLALRRIAVNTVPPSLCTCAVRVTLRVHTRPRRRSAARRQRTRSTTLALTLTLPSPAVYGGSVTWTLRTHFARAQRA
jgi:hypothetical protein